MQNDGKLTREMVFSLIFMSVLGNIVYTHTWIDNATDRSAWVASLAGISLVIPFAVWILYLGKLCPEATVFEMVDKGLGKIVSAVLCIPFILINALVAIAQLNMYTEMVKVFFLQNTPIWIIMLSLVLMGIMFISGELTIFARLVEALAILGMLNYFTSFIFAFPNNINVEYIIPIFDTSWLGFIQGAIFITGEASECLLLLMIIVRFIPDPFKHYKWVSYGIILSGVIFSIAILVIMTMMSPELAKRIAFGGVNAAKMLQIGDYVRGLEVFIFGTYNFIAVGKVSVCLYCSWIAMQKVLGSNKSMIQLFIIGLLIFVPSVLLGTYNKAYFLAVFMGNYVTLPFTIFILLLASISIFIKNKKAGSIAK